jgi:hypothetical protein
MSINVGIIQPIKRLGYGPGVWEAEQRSLAWDKNLSSLLICQTYRRVLTSSPIGG